jgi:2-dehydropantoate 2-reductase
VREIAILGPGGVGGLVAAALTRAGENVVVVAREATATVIARDGISVQSLRLGDFTAHPRAVAALTGEVDVLLVATKATTLEAALDRITAAPRLVVPLLNGLDHLALLRERFGAGHVAAGVIRVESSAPAPGQVRQTSPFLRIDLAAEDSKLRPGLEALAATLERAGIPTRIETSQAQVLWSKLVRLVALACTTSASGETIGFIRSDPEWRRTLLAAIDEAAAVANADGAAVDPAATVAELEAAHPGLGSSMQRDIALGRVPELDAIAGAVLRAGKRHGIDCPTIERLSLCIAERAGLAQPRV